MLTTLTPDEIADLDRLAEEIQEEIFWREERREQILMRHIEAHEDYYVYNDWFLHHCQAMEEQWRHDNATLRCDIMNMSPYLDRRPEYLDQLLGWLLEIAYLTDEEEAEVRAFLAGRKAVA